LIAYAVEDNLNGAGGKGGWEWLFIIEGAVAILVGILVWIFLPRFPDEIKTGKHWLFSEKDLDLALRRYRSKVEPVYFFRPVRDFGVIQSIAKPIS
jgi:hypothetical protein